MEARQIDPYAGLLHGAREMDNRFSHWFNALDKNGVAAAGLTIPKTKVFAIPTEIQIALSSLEMQGNYEIVQKWFGDVVQPGIEQAGFGRRLLFVKNAVFSGKFHGHNSCLTDDTGLFNSFIRIAQEAQSVLMCYDGNDELVVRERIMYDSSTTACIYNGLPFRPEFRIFYDFDQHKPIFAANYWDLDDAEENLYFLTDKIIFRSQGPYIQEFFEEEKDKVMAMVAEAMKGVSALAGPWSVDIMYDRGKYYLIDMAVAEESAYWDRRPGNEAIRAAALEAKQKAKEERERFLSQMGGGV